MRFTDITIQAVESSDCEILDAEARTCRLVFRLSNAPPDGWVDSFEDRANHFHGGLIKNPRVEGERLYLETEISSVTPTVLSTVSKVVIPAANAEFRERHDQQIKAQADLDARLRTVKI
jgi:hypothetical protein